MWKKYLIVLIVIFIFPVIGGKRKQSGKRFYDSFHYLDFTSYFLSINDKVYADVEICFPRL